MDISWAGQHWVLLGERALFWREKSTLILSDVHLGKAEDFQAAGVPVTSAVHREDLDKLSRLLETLRPRRVFVLGDFVHSNRLEHPHLAREFVKLKGSARWTLILGNHDLRDQLRLAQWRFDEILSDVREDGILFTHGDVEKESGFSMGGHVHPVLKIQSARDRMRLPCFVVNTRRVLLPAFGTFTGGFEIEPKSDDQVYLIADEEIVKWF
jgi:DNA ligase-associated metallophosphoesterase